jgi:hypothetical protein
MIYLPLQDVELATAKLCGAYDLWRRENNPRCGPG